ncbi:MAG: dockerin type I repeat-containing protein [Prevotella sp.]|nr:dockerin type I repeat-containing protein [Prevotella sp.]
MKITRLLLPIITLLLMTTSIHRVTAQTLQVRYSSSNTDHLFGDVNGDDNVDVADIAAVISVMAGKFDVSPEEADVNDDSKVDVADIAAIITAMAEVKDDETSYTSCPDENHPHAIDLGLPSGTKWACCNVGASTPEGYGNYYAWGETQPKSEYYWSTYAYYHNYNGNSNVDKDEIVDIGSDIAGTEYDAATANWGAPWHMPTHAQVDELMNNTMSTWTIQNGVEGRMFYGSNGGNIFLPAAGYNLGSGIVGKGSGGEYWVSTIVEGLGSFSDANYFGFNDDDKYIRFGWVSRCAGMTVRPAR